MDAGAALATARAVGVGDAIVSGVSEGSGVGTRLSVSVSFGEGDGVSKESGVALARGLTVSFGDGFAVVVGDGFGFAVAVGDTIGLADGVGVSTEVAGVLAWKGVEAASCARANTATESSKKARTIRRMFKASPEEFLPPTLARVYPGGQEQYRSSRISLRRSRIFSSTVPKPVDATESCH